MRVRPSLHLGQGLRLAMTPQMQQAIRLLQMSSVELQQEINTSLDSNLLLEVKEAEEFQSEEDEFLFSGTFEKSFDNFHTNFSTDNHDLLLQKPADVTLQQHLQWQMNLAHFTEHERNIALMLIDAISENGYLSCSLQEIQESLGFHANINEIESVLKRLQQFEPLGIGARSLEECLSIQLNSLPLNTPWLETAKLLVNHYLSNLGKRDYTSIQSKLSLSEAALKASLKLLTSLNPRPGTALFLEKGDYHTNMPDIIVVKKNGGFVVKVNKAFCPALSLTANYKELINRAATEEKYQMTLKEHLKEARFLIKSLETRHETLLKVATIVLEKQSEFLNFGEEKMRPLNLQDIAEKLGLHESTISRITTQKTILTPRGLFEFKYFFSNSLKDKKGSGISATAIRSLIKRFIFEEPSQNPLSDHKIRGLLLDQGIEIARRTVAKYREALKIPASGDRKHFLFK